MKTKRTTRVTAALNSMKKDDIYSLMLFILYKLKDVPDYLAISELAYILDGDNLTKFLSYYGGMTITIPTLKDLRLITKGMLLYQYVNMEGVSFDEALRAVRDDECTNEKLKETYSKILEVISNYEFTPRTH